jgi:predicted amino acid-binding ACT domain protein
VGFNWVFKGLNIHGTNLVMFADHFNVLITDIDVGALQNEVDQVIKELEAWFQRNDLKINVDKTVVISFHSGQKRVQ